MENVKVANYLSGEPPPSPRNDAVPARRRCGGRPDICAPLVADLTPAARQRLTSMTDRVYNVLFLCRNTARSILAESSLREDGAGVSIPSRRGATQRALSSFRGRDPRRIRLSDGRVSLESWDEFSTPDAPKMISCSRFATTRRRSLPNLAGSTDDRAFGYRSPRRRRGNGYREAKGFQCRLGT